MNSIKSKIIQKSDGEYFIKNDNYKESIMKNYDNKF